MKNYGVMITRPPNTHNSNCEFLVPQSLLSFQGIYNIFIFKTKTKKIVVILESESFSKYCREPKTTRYNGRVSKLEIESVKAREEEKVVKRKLRFMLSFFQSSHFCQPTLIHPIATPNPKQFCSACISLSNFIFFPPFFLLHTSTSATPSLHFNTINL